jgi:hypothetical protein
MSIPRSTMILPRFSTVLSAARWCRRKRRSCEQLFDAQELIVFRQAIRAAERTGLDLTAVRRHGNVGAGRVLGFTRLLTYVC